VTVAYTRVHSEDQVTEEILKIAQGIYDGWFDGVGPIDWENFLDRLDGAELADGSKIDLSEQMNSGAIRKIKREIRAYYNS
jgi:hypothetical protein